jgi:omega-amidase
MSGLRVSLLQQPLGRTLAQAGDAPATVNVELERAPLEAYREKFPAHLDADRFTLEP